MKNRLAFVLSSLAAGMVAGCSGSVHSVQWYQQHDTERKAVLKDCAEHPPYDVGMVKYHLSAEQNCSNAASAQTISSTNASNSQKG